MKILKIPAMLVLVISLALPGGVAEPNEEQSGANGLCEDYNAIYNVDGVFSPFAVFVEVAGGTGFIATQSGGAAITVDFYDQNGTWLDYSSSGSGNVPSAATVGTICVGALDFYPDLPAAGATWTYQDGF